MKIAYGAPIAAPSPAAPDASRPGGKGFSERLTDAIKEVNSLQQDADDAAKDVVQGKLGVHEGMLALGKADMSLRLLLQVRNKALEAYREIMRM